MTLAEFYAVYEKDVRPKLKENTWWSKEHIIRTKLIPYFGSRKMVDITVRDIIKWQNEMREYRDPAGKPYSPTYLKTVQAQLSCLFNHAVRFYELPSNPLIRCIKQVLLDLKTRKRCFSGQRKSICNLFQPWQISRTRITHLNFCIGVGSEWVN